MGLIYRSADYDENNSYETKPVLKSDSFARKLASVKGVKHIEEFGTKAGIIKTKSAIEGVVVKGIGKDYDWTYFNKRLVEGNPVYIPDTAKTNDVLISKLSATRLKLKLNDELITYFIQQPPRARRFRICGIYETGLKDSTASIFSVTSLISGSSMTGMQTRQGGMKLQSLILTSSIKSGKKFTRRLHLT